MKKPKFTGKSFDMKYKKYVIRKLEKNVVDDLDINFVFSTGLDLKEGLIDPDKAKSILANGKSNYKDDFYRRYETYC